MVRGRTTSVGEGCAPGCIGSMYGDCTCDILHTSDEYSEKIQGGQVQTGCETRGEGAFAENTGE